MSEVLTFPTKHTVEKVRTPEEVLERVLEALRDGSTKADQLIVTWCEEENDRIIHNYMLGGHAPLTSAIGLIELTKDSLMDPDDE